MTASKPGWAVMSRMRCRIVLKQESWRTTTLHCTFLIPGPSLRPQTGMRQWRDFESLISFALDVESEEAPFEVSLSGGSVAGTGGEHPSRVTRCLSVSSSAW